MRAPRTRRSAKIQGSLLRRALQIESLETRQLLSNVPPTIADFGPSFTYVEDAPARQISSTVTVADPDFNGGLLSISFSAGGTADDHLAIRNQGFISTSGADVFFNQEEIGTFSGGIGADPLVVNLNAQANASRIQVLLRNVVFRNDSQNPETAPRTLSAQLDDGEDASNVATKLIGVAARNDPPVVQIYGNRTYQENANPVLISPNAQISDVDSPHFAQWRLTVAITANADIIDFLAIRNQGNGAGQIGLSSNNRVLYEGVQIGTRSFDFDQDSMTVTLNFNATVAATQALLRNITFESSTDNPSTLPRTIAVSLSGPSGAASNTATKMIEVVAVNDSPQTSGVSGTQSYFPGDPPLLIFPLGTCYDDDSPNFDGGVLTIAISQGTTPEDRLAIATQADISTNGNEVLFKGIVFGTFSGGAGTNPLVVNLNANSRPGRVHHLLRSVVYSNEAVDSSGTRTVTVQIADGDGGTSSLDTKTLLIGNQPPQLVGIGGSLNYTQNSAPKVLAGGAVIDDPDSGNFAGGVLLIRVISGSDASNRFELGGNFAFDGDNVQLAGLTIGARNAGGGVGATPLEITFNAQATRSIVEGLLRSSLRFRTVNGTSTAQRVVEFSLTDGDGGASNPITKTINVV